ncbi:MAG: OmpA family protein [Bacteroidaceae bacterium]|nr:OmpA family protein [Bacteroidaceae bacterium]
MKGIKVTIFALCASMILCGCNGMTNMAKGGLIGSTAGGAAGTGIGALIGKLVGGKSGAKKGAAIGAAVGVAGGTTAGLLIGKKMDKAKAAAAALAAAQAEGLTDENGNTIGVRVTFDGGLLFQSGKSALTAAAQQNLTQFAQNVVTSDMDLAIVGHTDNDAWKGCTAAESTAKNQTLSEDRASAVSKYLTGKGITASQIKTVMGKGETTPVADNSTAAGKAQNRRVEVYIIPSDEMVAAANAGTLK